MNMISDYRVSSRDYLRRARQRLDESTPDSLFYAAFELRCGVESRIQEYLQVQNHISKSKKKGWQIAKLGHNLKRAFVSSDKSNKIAEISVRNKNTGKLIFTSYYTPVTKSLRDKTEALNSYMHAQKECHPLNNAWWKEFRVLLEKVYSELEIANKGTIIGPPVRYPTTQHMQIHMEFPDGKTAQYMNVKDSLRPGSKQIIEVKYHDTYPD